MQQQCDTRRSIVKSWARVKLESQESTTNLSYTNYRYPRGSIIGRIIDTSWFPASCCSFQMMGNQTSRSYLNEFCVIGREQLSWDWSQLEDPGGSRNTGSSRTDFAPVVGRTGWILGYRKLHLRRSLQGLRVLSSWRFLLGAFNCWLRLYAYSTHRIIESCFT